MKLRMIKTVTLVMMFVMIGFVHAQRANPQGRMRKMNHGRCMGLPDITEEQQETIQEINNEKDKSVLPLKGELEVYHAQLKQMMISDKPDKSGIMKKIDAIGNLRTQIRKIHTEAQLKIRALLTPDQRVRFDQGILEDREMAGHHGRDRNRRVRKIMKIRKPGLPMDTDEEDVEVEIEELHE